MSDTEDFDFDDDPSFDFDDDFENMDSGESENVDDRNPVSKASKAAIDTVGEELQNTERVMSTVKENMPSGYQAAWRQADDVVSTTKELYNDAAKDLKPALTQLKKNTKRLLPMVKGVMPESIGNKVEAFLSEDSSVDDAQRAADDADTAAIASSLGNIFQQQAENDQSEKQEEIARETIRDNVKDAQANKSLSLNVDISNQLAKINAYNDNVQSKVSRQALELKFRTYFTLRDLLAVTKSTSQDTVERLSDIVKNTALPEVVKIQQSEVFLQQYRERMYGKAHEKMADFGSRMKDNLVGKAKEKIQGIKDAVEQGVEMSGQLAEAQEMSAEAGLIVDPTELAGQMAAGNVMDRVFRRFGSFAGDMMRKNDTLMTGSNILDQVTGDTEGVVRTLADADENTELMGVKVKDNFFLNMLSKAAGVADPGSVSEMEQLSVMSNQSASIKDPAIYDVMTRKSIVEIIPEYLSRILSETIKFNGGDGERLTYNLEKGRLTTIGEAARSATKTMDNRDNDNTYGDNVVELVNNIDDGEDLNLEDKEVLAKFMMEQSESKQLFDPASMLEKLKGSLSDTDQEERIVQVLMSSLGIGEDGKMVMSAANTGKARRLSKDYMKLRQHEVNGSEELTQYAAAGGLDVLREAGLLNDGESGYMWNQDKTDKDRMDAIHRAFRKDRDAGETAREFMGDTDINFDNGGSSTPLMLSGVPGGFSVVKPGGGGPTKPSTPLLPAPPMADGTPPEPDPVAKATSVLADPIVKRDIKAHADTLAEESVRRRTKPVTPDSITPNEEVTPGNVTPTPEDSKPLGMHFGGKQGGYIGAMSEPGPQAEPFDSKPIVDILGCIKDNTANILTAISGGLAVTATVTPPPIEDEPEVIEDSTDEQITEQLAATQDAFAVSAADISQSILGAMEHSSSIIAETQSVTHGLLQDLLEVSKHGFDSLLDRAGVAVEVQKKKGLLRRAVGGTFGLGWKGLKGGVGLGWKGAKGAAGLGLSAIKKTAGAAWGATKGIVGGVAGALTKPFRGLNWGDIYVKGSNAGRPILTKARLAAGEYYDAESGEVISKFSKRTLQNGVKDKDGNYILTPEHIEKGLTNVNGKKLSVKLGKGVAWLLNKSTFGLAGKAIDAFKGIGKLGGKLNTKVKRFVGKALRTDIYVAGEEKPRLLYRDMLDRKYRSQKTGLVLESFADIDGAVTDASGVIVLAEDELDMIRTSAGVKLKLKGAIGAYASLAMKPVKLLFKPLTWMNDIRKDRKDKRENADVYVAGDKTPRLTAVKLRAGEYFYKDGGKQLTDFWKITGPIADASGKVLLTDEEIEGGLYTQWGKKIQAGIIKRMFKTAFKMGSGVLNAMSLGKFGKALEIDEEGDGTVKKIVKHFVNKMDVRARSVKIYTGDADAPKSIGDSVRGFFSKNADGESKADSLMTKAKGKLMGQEGNRNMLQGAIAKTTGFFTSGKAKEKLDETVERVRSIDDNDIETAKDAVRTKFNEAHATYDEKSEAFRELMQPRMDELKAKYDEAKEDDNSLVSKATARKDKVVNSAKHHAKLAKRKLGLGEQKEDTVGPPAPLKVRATNLATDVVDKAKKKVFGDADGDGDRDGGRADTLAERAKEKADEAKEATTAATAKFQTAALGLFDKQNKIADENKENTEDLVENSSGLFGFMKKWGGMALSALGSVVSGVVGLGKAIMAKVFGGAAADGMDMAGDLVDGPDGKKTKGKKGWWNKLKRGAKSVVKFGAKHSGKLLTAGSSLVGTSALSAIGTGLATAAGAVGTVLASPVVLVGAAVAAVGAGAYYAYKYAQRRKKIHPLEGVRFAQYGADIFNIDDVVAVRYLEDKLEGDVSAKSIDLDVVEVVEDYASDFGIGDDDLEGKNMFAVWLGKRFLPVFQTWQKATATYGTDTRSAHDDIDMKDFVPLAKSTMYSSKDKEYPYNVPGPFTVQIGLDDINKAIDDLAAMKTGDERVSSMSTERSAEIARAKANGTEPSPVEKATAVVKEAPTVAPNAAPVKTYKTSEPTETAWKEGEFDPEDFPVDRNAFPMIGKRVPGIANRKAKLPTREYGTGLWAGVLNDADEQAYREYCVESKRRYNNSPAQRRNWLKKRDGVEVKFTPGKGFNANVDGDFAEAAVKAHTKAKRSAALNDVSKRRQELAKAQIDQGVEVDIPPSLMAGATPTKMALLNESVLDGRVVAPAHVKEQVKREAESEAKAVRTAEVQDAVKRADNVEAKEKAEAAKVQTSQLSIQQSMNANLAALVKETREANKAILAQVNKPVEVKVKAEPIEVIQTPSDSESKGRDVKLPTLPPGERTVRMPVSMAKSNLQK